MLTQAFSTWSLRQQIILFTGGAILLFGFSAGEFVRRIEANAFERNFRTQTDTLVEVLAATSLDAILSEDRTGLTTTIASLVESDPDVETVRIYTDPGKLLAAWNAAAPEEHSTPIEMIDISRDVVLDGKAHGQFEVSWNVTRQNARLKALGQRIYFYAAGLSVLLALLVISLVNALVGRPIRTIDRQLKSLHAGEDVAPLATSNCCELSNLAHSVNELGHVLELRRLNELELEEASRAKGELLANMSHELRTPMNGVLGMLNLLSESPLTHTQAGQVRIATSSGQNLLDLINDILDFSKVEAGKLEFEAISFDLETLVEETLELMAPEAYGKGLEIEYEIEDSLRESVTGDPTRIRQILTNLTANAIKFTSAGCVSIAVEQTRNVMTPATHDRIRFTVTDTGIGISRKAQASIFESFKQADGSTTRLHGGTGLGLAISRQLAEGMNGSIGVDSGYGKGSSFWFELELPSSGRSLAERARTAVDGMTPGLAYVVDSSERSIATVIRGLRELDIEAKGYQDSQQLLAALRESVANENKPGILIIGDEAGDTPRDVLARCLESDPAFDNITLVALTQLTSESAMHESHSESRLKLSLHHPVGRRALTRLFWSTDLATHQQQGSHVTRLCKGSARFANETVLIVEDNPVNQQVALGVLEQLGFNAEITSNGQEGLDRIAHGGISLVLMDCQMPVFDGYAATAELRRREAESHTTRTPVIALTANAMNGDAERCLDAGMDDYLTKPFDPIIFEEKIAYWLCKRRDEDQGRQMALAGGFS